MKFDSTLAAKLLGHTLNKLYSKDAIKAGIGMEPDEASDEFWEIQRLTACNRFYWYLLHTLGLPLTLERESLTAEQFGLIMYAAQANLRDGLHYREVRNWWLTGGSFLHEQAFEARRKAKLLAQRGIRVLVFFDNNESQVAPLFLAYEGVTPVLVKSKEEAHVFPILHEHELSSNTLQERTPSFDGIVRHFAASHVKLVIGGA